MSRILIIISLFLPRIVFSLEVDSLKHNRKDYFGLYYTPQVNQTNVGDYSLGYDIGVSYLAHEYKHLFVEMKMYYKSNDFLSEKLYVNGPFSNTYLTTYDIYTYQYNYFGLSWALNFSINNNKLTYFISPCLAIETSFSLNTRVNRIYPNGLEISSEDTHSSALNSSFLTSFSAGIDYELHNRIRMRIQPIYKIYAHNEIRQFQNNTLGVNFGILFSFRK